ncbi:SRPBCC domain-containing protein [Chitinophagaceae bacterium 26-R-25]|nr:SRPBCC domain-containing protein [Chitinophagaceae bacterium 26-R-25]
MERGTIKKTVDINAPAAKVWNVLTQDEYTRIWYATFMEGTHAITDWKQGSKVTFLDGDNNGVFGKIVELKPNEKISVLYEGAVENGQETTTSEDAKDWIGSSEIYSLSGADDSTTMNVDFEGPAKYINMFIPMWEKALQKIKALSEE